ncbi:MAG: type II toxin-antitoxin system HicB family antitoxin [Cardiobacterium sp.]
MLFTIGVESPKNDNEAYGLIVPALNDDHYACISAADHANDILRAATDAIATVLQDRAENGLENDNIKDLGYRAYQQHPDYTHCDTWLLADIDISEYTGKRQRININVPDYLLRRIDQRVAANSRYKDRSHFLALAAQRELEEA